MVEGHVKMEVEIRVMLPQAKGHQELLETGRGKDSSSCRDFRDAWP